MEILTINNENQKFTNRNIYIHDIIIDGFSNEYDVEFVNCNIKVLDETDIIINKKLKSLKFTNCIFENLNNFIQIEANLQELKFYNVVGPNLIISNSKIEIKLINTFFNQIEFDNLNDCKSVEIIFNNLIYNFEKVYILIKNRYLLGNQSRIPSYFISNSSINKIIVKKESKIYGSDLSINYLEKIKLDFYIEKNIYINEFYSNKINFNIIEIKDNIEKVKLSYIKVYKLFFLNIHKTNIELYNFSGLSSNAIFQIYDSNMENMTFWDVDFRLFKIFEIHKTFIEKANFNLITFPKKFEKSSYLTFENQYDMYRQLFNIFNNNGDIKNAIYMKSMYLDAYRKSKFKSKEDCLILYLNWLSNNYGTKILWPFLWIVFISLVFTFLVININYNYVLSYKGVVFALNNFKENFGVIMFNSILNPLALIDKDLIKTNGQYFLIFFAKIIIAYLIYQFIVAFRRFGKTF
jgi:hypothetical protein